MDLHNGRITEGPTEGGLTKARVYAFWGDTAIYTFIYTQMGTELIFKWGARTYLATVTVVGKLVSGGDPLGVDTYWMPWIPWKPLGCQGNVLDALDTLKRPHFSGF